MTVQEFFETCDCRGKLRVKSAYNGKILCYAYDPNKHTEIGKRELCCIWADITVANSGFGDYALPILCCYANGAEEYAKERMHSNERNK